MREARHNPRIVRYKNVKSRLSLFKHHLTHLLRTFMQRIKRIVFASIKPLADSFVKTFTQCLLVRRNVTNKEITKRVKRRNCYRATNIARKPATFRNALCRFNATPHRTRKIHRITKRRDNTPQRNGLTAPTFRKPYMCSKVLILRRNVITLSMAQQQINFGIPISLCKKIRSREKVSSHFSIREWRSPNKSGMTM